jgi:hypothetical protein
MCTKLVLYPNLTRRTNILPAYQVGLKKALGEMSMGLSSKTDENKYHSFEAVSSLIGPSDLIAINSDRSTVKRSNRTSSRSSRMRSMNGDEKRGECSGKDDRTISHEDSSSIANTQQRSIPTEINGNNAKQSCGIE